MVYSKYIFLDLFLFSLADSRDNFNHNSNILLSGAAASNVCSGVSFFWRNLLTSEKKKYMCILFRDAGLQENRKLNCAVTEMIPVDLPMEGQWKFPGVGVLVTKA